MAGKKTIIVVTEDDKLFKEIVGYLKNHYDLHHSERTDLIDVGLVQKVRPGLIIVSISKERSYCDCLEIKFPNPNIPMLAISYWGNGIDGVLMIDMSKPVLRERESMSRPLLVRLIE